VDLRQVGALGLVLVTGCSRLEAPGAEVAEPALERAVSGIGAVPDLTGIIRELAPEGWILVEVMGAPEPSRVRIGYETNLHLAAGGVAGHWADLAVGRRVSVWLRDTLPEAPARMVMIEDELEG
jgi:hypothetical protein